MAHVREFAGTLATLASLAPLHHHMHPSPDGNTTLVRSLGGLRASITGLPGLQLLNNHSQSEKETSVPRMLPRPRSRLAKNRSDLASLDTAAAVSR